MALQFQIIPVTSYQQNCSLIWCDETKKGAVIDPGGDIERILAVVEKNNITVEKILLTHGHLDHVGGTMALAKALSIKIEGPHKADTFWLEALVQQSEMFGFALTSPFLPNKWFENGDVTTVGNQTLHVFHTPGHTPGHVIFFNEEAQLAFVGDVLFSGSIGRTDFPQGNHATLIQSIQEKLWPLGNDVTFVPGHGPNSTFGRERNINPFVSDAALSR
jgi:glyoxylase-like metal-dependent hydrolase (beta-lactamase superfamily II)